MRYDPKTDIYPYPEDTDKHYLKVKKNDGTVFDEHYPYVDKSKKFLGKQRFLKFLICIIIFPMTHIRMGLRIKGRKNLKKHKELLKKGALSVSNHVHMWDYLCVMNGLRFRKTYLLAWAPNVSGESGKSVRLVGGVPIPENDMRATIECFKQIDDLLNGGGWLHIYPEGSMWEYYAPIRPFKSGASYFACRNNKPIVPLAFSYRKPNWIRRVFFRQIATFTLNIGEPLLPDESLPIKEREIDLTKRCHDAVCMLSGVNPEESLYEPIFNHSKRIDYYTTMYGAKYKGSK